MFVGSALTLRGDGGRNHVIVELWQIGHTSDGISFSTSGARPTMRGDGSRVLTIPIPEIVKLTPARRAGDYFTRTLLTLRRDTAERLQLAPWAPRVFVDALFRFESRDPMAFRVGVRHGHMWCHLFCAPGDEHELHTLACSREVGMRRQWFQGQDPEFPHYDLVPPRRVAAVRAGAVEVELRVWLEERRAAAAGQNQEGSS